MNGKETEHLKDFVESRLEVDEKVEHHLEGVTGNPFGRSFRRGQFVVTTKRACFHTKGNDKLIEFEIANIKRVALVNKFLSEWVVEDGTLSLSFKTPESRSYVAEAFGRLEELRRQCIGTSIDAAETNQSLPGKVFARTELKVCPDCAEEVKSEARICRYCRYEFVETRPSSPPNDADAAIAMALNISYEEVIPESLKRAKIYLNDIIISAKALGLPPMGVATRANSLGFRVKSFGRRSPSEKLPPAKAAIRSAKGGGPTMAVIIPIESGNHDHGSYDGGGDGGGDGD